MAAKGRKRAKNHKRAISKPTQAERADPHLLYQAAVQCTASEQAFVNQTFMALRQRQPLSLREDFCGTALAACHWVQQSSEHQAVAVDIDPAVIDWGVAHNVSALSAAEQQRLDLLCADVMSVETPRVDVLQALNFSYWLWQERGQMLAYFQATRQALNPDGLLFLDVYGGFEAHRNQIERRECEGFTYLWEQCEHNPVTSRMCCRIHFEFEDGSRLENAFSYQWRIWGAKELREVLIDAGFSRVTLYRQDFDEQTDEPVDRFIPTDEAEDWACWLGYLVAEP